MELETALLRELTPGQRFLIWTHDGPLDQHTPGIASMNYLLDGLVLGHISSHPAASDQVVFSHQLFGQSFWLIFANTSALDPQALLPSLKSILASQTTQQGATLFTRSALPTPWKNGLAQLFPDLKILDFSAP